MEDVNVPSPNPFITQWLLSGECHTMMQARAEQMLALYVEHVHKRTGRLAASAHAEVVVGGLTRSDRYIARLTVGNATAPYAASHEFGTGRTDPLNVQDAAHDLNYVLDMVGKL